MVNNQFRNRLGPLPAGDGSVSPISTARAAVLERLRAEPGPCTVERLAVQTGQHRNTIREHLEALVGLGMARRTTAAHGDRGRPAWLYQAAVKESEGQGYAALAAALASHIARTSEQPRAEGIRAGELWAKHLQLDKPPDGPAETSDLSARRRTVALLESVGFGVEPDASWNTVRLTVCPLLLAARETPQVVCAVHLGLVRGSLSSMGADPDQADLIPFAQPGACLLHLGGPLPEASAAAIREGA